MAETSPPPTAGAESYSEEPATGGEQRLEEPSRAATGGEDRGGEDREGEAGPPLGSPGGQSEPGSPVAAPFFLLYPGDGGAGFAARPPPQQQRAWRTPPSPGSPLPFLLLSYPGGGGGGKHREWRRGRAGPRSSASRWVSGAGRRAGGEVGALGKHLSRGAGAAVVRAPDYLPPSLPWPRAPARRGLPSSPGPGAHPRQTLTCSPGPRPRPGWEPPGGVEEGAAPGHQQPRRPAFRGLPAPLQPSRCGRCAAAGAASVYQ